MLWTIVVVLAILWMLGMLAHMTMGGTLHVLLIVALLVVVYDFITRRRTT